MAVDHELERRHAAGHGFGILPPGESSAAHRGLAAGADENHRDPAGGGQGRIGSDDPAQLDHPAQPILGAREKGPLSGRSGKADDAGVAAEIGRPRRFPCSLIDEAYRIETVDAEFALAALRQEGDSGQAGVELEGVAVAHGPPADLAGAAEEATAKLVAKEGRPGQHGPVGRRGPFAGGKKAGHRGARRFEGNFHHPGVGRGVGRVEFRSERGGFERRRGLHRRPRRFDGQRPRNGTGRGHFSRR